jgi:general secretion pathway protein F
MNYELRLFDTETGRVSQHQIAAVSEQDALDQAQSLGLHVLSAKPLSSRRMGFKLIKPAVQYPLFCREMRTLLVAGMGVVEAVDTLCDFDLRGKKVLADEDASLARQLRDRLQQGQSLSTALSALPGVPPVLLACVRSVEHTSNLLEALDDYLRYNDMMAQLRSKVVSAAIYPAIVSTLGIGITAFLLIVVMPQFAQMYNQLRGQARGMTWLIISLSQWMASYRLLFVAACAVLLLSAVWWFMSGRGTKVLGRWGWRVAWVRAQVMDYQLALFYQTLHLLSKGGYALVPALQIARMAAVSSMLQAQVQHCQSDIEQGRSVSASLHLAGLANEVDRRLLAAAEDNGDFYKVAFAIAQLHRSRFELMVERLTRIIEPVLLLAVALLVGTVVVVMYTPVFEMGVMTR